MGIFRKLGHGWTASLHDIGNFQSRALLTVFYFTVLVPFALLTRLFGDPLRLKERGAKTSWLAWSEREASLDSARQQG